VHKLDNSEKETKLVLKLIAFIEEVLNC